MRRGLILISVVGLFGCGAETGGTAAIGAAGQVEQARQAQQLKQDVQYKVNEALQAEQQKLRQASEAAGN